MRTHGVFSLWHGYFRKTAARVIVFVFYLFLAPVHSNAHNEQIPCSGKTLTHHSPPKSPKSNILLKKLKKKIKATEMRISGCWKLKNLKYYQKCSQYFQILIRKYLSMRTQRMSFFPSHVPSKLGTDIMEKEMHVAEAEASRGWKSSSSKLMPG